ncbi:MAG: trigger factor [Alphaproteobacteria bacterium]
MEIKVKKIKDDKLKKDFELNFSKELIEKKINDYIAKVQGNFTLKGFRKGQVPFAVIKEKYGQSIMADELDKMINEKVKEIVKEGNLKLAMQPKIEAKEIDLGKDAIISLSLEIFPEIPEIELKKIKVVKREVAVDENDVKQELQKFNKFFATWEKQDSSYKAKNGDAVNIDYVGRIDKVEFDGGKAQGHQLELGSKSFIDDFEEQLIGKKAGDEVKVKVKFPKAYHAEALAGQNAEFEVKINEVLVAKLPELSKEFVKEKFNLEDPKALEDLLRKDLTKKFEEMSLEIFKNEVLEFLNKKYDFELPKGLVEVQANALWQSIESEIEKNPHKFKNDKEKEKAKKVKEEQAIEIIRGAMILSKICEQNKIEVTKEDFDKELFNIMQNFRGQEQKVIEYYQKNPQAIEGIRAKLIEDKAINFVANNELIEKKAMNIKDFEKFFTKANEETSSRFAV